MRSALPVASGPGFTLHSVTCRDDHRGWSRPALSAADHGLVLVRRGRFRRLSGPHAAVLDPTHGYLRQPGEEERFAHPAGGDLCTSLALTPALWHRLAGDGSFRPALYVDGRLDLAHRRVLRAARSGDPGFALVESLLGLLEQALAQTASGPTPATGSTPRALVDRAREALLDDHPASRGLLSLADHLAVSPFQLSRAFTRTLGVSLTHYRNRVRVSRALDRIEEGETSLAVLAADLGFADQAHLTRTIRSHVGHTPTALRRFLT